MAPAVRGMRGWLIATLVLALAAIAVTGAWLVLRERPAPGDIVDIVNIDGDHAVLIREIRGDPRRSFASLFHARDGERWGAIIPRYARPPGASTAVAATAEVVTVRTSATGVPTMIAFSAKGKKLGKVAPLGERSDATGGSFDLASVGNVFGGGMSFEVYGDIDDPPRSAAGGEPSRWITIVATDLTAGSFAWTASLDPAPVGPIWLRERHLLAHQPGVLHVLERQTGAARRVPVAARPCVLGSAVYTLHDGVLSSLRLADGSESRVPVAGDALAGARSHGQCGRRGSTLVMAVAQGGRDAVLGLDAGADSVGSAATIRWRIDLPGLLSATAVTTGDPDALPLSGMLPRHVPLLLETSMSGPDSLIMLDVETGRVAWRAGDAPWLAGAHLASADGRHYLSAPARELLAVLDGESGALAAAVRLPGHAPVWPRSIAGAHIWVHAGARWTVLDAASLAVVAASAPGASFADVRGELAGELARNPAPAGALDAGDETAARPDRAPASHL